MTKPEKVLSEPIEGVYWGIPIMTKPEKPNAYKEKITDLTGDYITNAAVITMYDQWQAYHRQATKELLEKIQQSLGWSKFSSRPPECFVYDANEIINAELAKLEGKG